ncbi:metallophosphoesterase [Pseudanabaena sp. 'Roaring Creek']|uniref:metallophosphoesterase family protein n=1 Tax=Pseudanabaena sp. 'Roaring Creek' TaxID=1681830 RepID=UPI0006D815CB|nr:metallophosphoesterase [Pseudanabaena sp. 'Roaring Creek']
MNIQRIFKSLRSNLFRFVLFAIASCSIIIFLATQPSFSKNEELVFSDNDIDFSFVVVGCNRADKADVDKTAPSTANIEQLKRTFKEVSELSPPPKFLFFAGDLVFGYTSDTAQLESQLKGWRDLYENSPLASSKTTLIPITGNHETQNEKKKSYKEAEKTWIEVMEPYLKYAGNGPHAGGKDNLKTDQSKLTYSFDYKGTHFVILNTDPVGRDYSVPKAWVAKDLQTARSRFAKHIFAIGHKPAYALAPNLYVPPLEKEDGLGRLYPDDRDEFWASLVKNKAEAMLAAHNHIYSRLKGPNGNTWQIIAGNGGSVLEKVVDQSKNNSYGFTLVSVLKNNHVTVTSYGRDVPKEGYLAPSEKYPTTIRDRGDISWNN